MKLSAALIVMVLSSLAGAKDINPADYPVTAHVLGSIQGHRPSGAWACTYQLGVGNLVYTAIHNGNHCDDAVTPGANLPARILKNKITVLRNGKELSLEVIGTHE